MSWLKQELKSLGVSRRAAECPAGIVRNCIRVNNIVVVKSVLIYSLFLVRNKGCELPVALQGYVEATEGQVWADM